MPDLLSEMDSYCRGYDNPNVTIGDWRLFVDDCGFLPSAHNTLVIGRVLAWNKGIDRYYASLIGCEDGAFPYQKGDKFPEGLVQRCRIGREWAVEHGDSPSDIAVEIIKSINELAVLVCASEGLENPLIANPITIEDISKGERIIWSGNSLGQKLRAVRREDQSISFQVATGDDTWSQAWP